MPEHTHIHTYIHFYIYRFSNLCMSGIIVQVFQMLEKGFTLECGKATYGC
jgi:hypothetical protein